MEFYICYQFTIIFNSFLYKFLFVHIFHFFNDDGEGSQEMDHFTMVVQK